MLHVNIIYLACRGKKYATLQITNRNPQLISMLLSHKIRDDRRLKVINCGYERSINCGYERSIIYYYNR